MNNILFRFYLFPTIFTAANMFCGFWSIVLSIKGSFVRSAWLVVLGIIFDGVDGIIARAKNVSSVIGAELDSLADLLTFCVAPIVLVWQLVGYRYGFPGIMICFLYIFFGALRLAKFNFVTCYKQQNQKITFYEGLPTPAAAGIIVSIILLLSISSGESGLTKKHITFLLAIVPFLENILPAIILFLGLLMITKFRYPKVNNIKLTQKVSLKVLTIVIVTTLLIFSYPESSIFLIFAVYVLYGVTEYFIRIYKLKKLNKQQ
jgi:CDP-diacylglycerol--serine O-phosphatidyltransferase